MPTQRSKVAPQLPVPSGPFGIGRIACDWIDTSRPDRFSSLPQAHRELMVYLWYPTRTGCRRQRRVFAGREADGCRCRRFRQRMRDDYGVNWPLIVSGAIYSHAVDNAAPAKKPLKFPVVVLSHGLGGSGFGYTSLIEDLVSRGYVVAAIEHTYAAGAVVFPNGTIVPEHHDSAPPGLTPEEGMKRMMASVGATITEGAGGCALRPGQADRAQRRPRRPVPRSPGGSICATLRRWAIPRERSLPPAPASSMRASKPVSIWMAEWFRSPRFPSIPMERR